MWFSFGCILLIYIDCGLLLFLAGTSYFATQFCVVLLWEKSVSSKFPMFDFNTYQIFRPLFFKNFLNCYC